MYIVGIDAGATSTKVVLASSDGTVLQWAQGPSCNLWVTGIEGVVNIVVALVAQLSEAIPGFVIDVLVAGVSGAGRKQDQNELQKALQTALPIALVLVQDDSQIALRGALLDKAGVVVIAGTGSIAYGINTKGQTERAGGYGHLLGDQGSAFDIGRKAINLCLQGNDGIKPRNLELEAVICDYYAVTRIEHIITEIYNAPNPKGSIAGIARVITHLASSNSVCQELLNQAGHDLSLLAMAVINKLNLEPKTGGIAVHGGVFCSGKWVLRAMEASMKERAPGFALGRPCLPPVFGAILNGIKDSPPHSRDIAAKFQRSSCPFLVGEFTELEHLSSPT